MLNVTMWAYIEGVKILHIVQYDIFNKKCNNNYLYCKILLKSDENEYGNICIFDAITETTQIKCSRMYMFIRFMFHA